MKILVADDDPANRQLFVRMLELMHYEVVMATNGVEAVEQFRNESPDIILMDALMPEMDGFTATSLIKAECGERFVPVIFVTAETDEEQLARCVDAGGDDFITKPVNRIILKAKLDAFKRIYHLHAAISEHKQKLETAHEMNLREQRVAKSIHNSIVNRNHADLDCVRCFGRPSTMFNGDIACVARNPSGGVNILLGDFTGHGLSAAIGAIPTSDVFYSMTAKGFTVRDIAHEINHKLYRLLPTSMFMAAGFVRLDVNYQVLEVWNAGLPDILIRQQDGNGEFVRVRSSHVPLGILDDGRFDVKSEIIEVSPGDHVYLYTDGITDIPDGEHHRFGSDRLEQLIMDTPPDAVIPRFEKVVSGLLNQAKPWDDMTLLQMECTPELLRTERQARDNIRVHTGSTGKEWYFELELRDEMLRDVDPMPVLAQVLADIQGLEDHHSNLYTILSELYSNALEHGVLGLESGMKACPDGFNQYYQERDTRLQKVNKACIRIRISSGECKRTSCQCAGCLTISVEDSGGGFDWPAVQAGPVDRLTLSGRGISLVRSLCDEVEFNTVGNTVQVRYLW